MLIEDLGGVAESPLSSPQPELEPLHLRVSPATSVAVIVAILDDRLMGWRHDPDPPPHYNWSLLPKPEERSRSFQ
jgi:hypothetical protein